MSKPTGLYVRLSCDAMNDTKLVAAGLDGYWLWSKGLLYSKQHLSDGFVPANMLASLAAGLIRSPFKVASKLVQVGLWEQVEGGFRVPIDNWRRWQTTREDVEEQRRQVRERVAKHRVAISRNADVTRYSRVSNANVTPPEPEPEPEHRVTEELRAADASASLESAPMLILKAGDSGTQTAVCVNGVMQTYVKPPESTNAVQPKAKRKKPDSANETLPNWTQEAVLAWTTGIAQDRPTCDPKATAANMWTDRTALQIVKICSPYAKVAQWRVCVGIKRFLAVETNRRAFNPISLFRAHVSEYMPSENEPEPKKKRGDDDDRDFTDEDYRRIASTWLNPESSGIGGLDQLPMSGT